MSDSTLAVEKLSSVKIRCPNCPELEVGQPFFTSGGPANAPVSFPLVAGDDNPYSVADIGITACLDLACCGAAIDYSGNLVVRWHFKHSIAASAIHTGFNVSAQDDAGNTYNTIVAQSSGNASVNVGPAVTPHAGYSMVNQWVDLEIPLSAIQPGADGLPRCITFNTSAFGTFAGTPTITETLHSTRLEIRSGLAAAGCDCEDKDCAASISKRARRTTAAITLPVYEQLTADRESFSEEGIRDAIAKRSEINAVDRKLFALQRGLTAKRSVKTGVVTR